MASILNNLDLEQPRSNRPHALQFCSRAWYYIDSQNPGGIFMMEETLEKIRGAMR